MLCVGTCSYWLLAPEFDMSVNIQFYRNVPSQRGHKSFVSQTPSHWGILSLSLLFKSLLFRPRSCLFVALECNLSGQKMQTQTWYLTAAGYLGLKACYLQCLHTRRASFRSSESLVHSLWSSLLGRVYLTVPKSEKSKYLV